MHFRVKSLIIEILMIIAIIFIIFLSLQIIIEHFKTYNTYY
jgi:hypothetical protein